MAELAAIKMALETFVKIGFPIIKELVIESDVEVVIGWCKDPKSRPWRLWELFIYIDYMIDSLKRVRFSSIYREANGLADSLAKRGVDRREMFEAWW